MIQKCYVIDAGPNEPFRCLYIFVSHETSQNLQHEILEVLWSKYGWEGRGGGGGRLKFCNFSSSKTGLEVKLIF